MEPVLLSFHAPAHDLDIVAQHVVREDLTARLATWQRQSRAEELVYVATCQRVLWMLWGGEPKALGLAPDVRRYEGEAAWSHLLSVAAGLESAKMGDREIPGQLMDALAEARRAQVAGPEAQAAIEDIIREALRLRSRLGLADGTVSVATAALRHLEEALAPGSRIALVGVGPMSSYLAERLPERGFRVTLANRTQAKAEALAAPLGLPVVPLATLQADPEGFDAIVSATGSPVPLFTLEAWDSLPGRSALNLLDLALPADTDEALQQLPWIKRVDLVAFLAETASARAQRVAASHQAEPHLLASLGRLRKKAAERARKRASLEAKGRLQDAWARLEREATGGVFQPLVEDQQAQVESLLRRGRTLAHRALAQCQALESEQGFQSGVACE